MNRMTRSLLFGTVSLAVTTAAADLAFTSPAVAGTESFSAYYPSSSTFATTPWDGSETVSLPLFNSGLGTLTGVTVELLETVQTYGSVQNTALTAGHTATIGHNGYGSAVEGGVFANGTSLPITSTAGAIVTAGATVVSLTKNTKLTPGQTITFGSSTSPVTHTAHSTSSVMNVSHYVGVGSTTFLLYANATTTGGFSGGNLSITQHTVVQGEVLITYDYNTVPEPASMAVLGTGVVALGATRHRKGRISDFVRWLHRRRSRG
jgi:hypothetical protein